MSRVIKFRAWTGEQMLYPPDGYMFEATVVATNYPGGIGLNKFGRKQMELMQFTGLMDKSGKYIYEGDIIHFNTSYENSNDDYDYSTEPARVQWSEGVAGFWPFYLNSRWRCDVENVEIIGNIYENPELIPQLQTAR